MTSCTSYRTLALLIILFIVHLLLRLQNVTAQGAYVDEGVHSMFGATAWALNINPGRFSDGKFLLFYYLGLFEAQSTTALFVSRTAIALFSLITVAVIYQLGRALHSTAAGIVAVAIYC